MPRKIVQPVQPIKIEPIGIPLPKIEYIKIPEKLDEIPVHLYTLKEIDFMTALWNWLNGNKTIFGLAIITLANSLPADTTIWVIPIVPVLQWVGTTLGGVGVVHKALKANTEPGSNH